MKQSPYENLDEEKSKLKTKELISSFPIKMDELKDIILNSWSILWQTRVGNESTGFPLINSSPTAQIVGSFLEKLAALELARRYPTLWKPGEGSQKDFHCIGDESFSFEMKSSGQLGYKIFGNRSYGQSDDQRKYAKKDRSGFYLTVNFYQQTITLIRFGWIDSYDWQSQAASSGQAAVLSDHVYKNKMIELRGKYQLASPVELVNGVGGKSLILLHEKKIYSVLDLLTSNSEDRIIEKYKSRAEQMFGDLIK